MWNCLFYLMSSKIFVLRRCFMSRHLRHKKTVDLFPWKKNMTWTQSKNLPLRNSSVVFFAVPLALWMVSQIFLHGQYSSHNATVLLSSMCTEMLLSCKFKIYSTENCQYSLKEELGANRIQNFDWKDCSCKEKRCSSKFFLRQTHFETWNLFME